MKPEQKIEQTLTPAEERRIRAESSFFDEVYAEAEPDALSFKTSNLCDINEFFNHLIGEVNGMRVLSIGGGIDYTAVHLASTGAHVCSTDVSRVACEKTRLLASHYRLKGALQVLQSSCEHLKFHQEFDMVISKGVLHHVNFAKGVARVKEALVDRGVLVALEPICLSKIIGFFQKNFPFHPQTLVTPDEIKLSHEELKLLRGSFSKLEYYYFDLLSRPSITYLLSRIKASALTPVLKIADAYLVERAHFLTHYCQHIVFRAEK
jgi:protein-L-isoaspartate O-methyltransferase